MVMVVVVSATRHGMTELLPGAGTWTRSLRLSVAIGGGLTALIAAGKLLGIAELEEAMAFVRGRAQKLLGSRETP
jgi:hypothetical protein